MPKKHKAKKKATKPLKKLLRRQAAKKPVAKVVRTTTRRQSNTRLKRRAVAQRKAAVSHQRKVAPVKQPEILSLTFTAEDMHHVAVALSPCISNDETRPYLHGVYIDNDPDDPQGFRFVATDGHRLGIYKRKHMSIGKKPCRFRGILSSEAISYFAGIKPKLFTSFTLEIQGMTLAVHAKDGTTIKETRRFEMNDGNFPDWERCLPIHFHAPHQAFRARYLADIAKAVHKLSATTDNGFPSIALAHNGNNSTGPAWLLTDIEGLRYVLMPQTTSGIAQAPKIEERPVLQRLQAVSTLLWQIKLGKYPELPVLQREIDGILSRMIEAVKAEPKSA